MGTNANGGKTEQASRFAGHVGGRTKGSQTVGTRSGAAGRVRRAGGQFRDSCGPSRLTASVPFPRPICGHAAPIARPPRRPRARGESPRSRPPRPSLGRPTSSNQASKRNPDRARRAPLQLAAAAGPASPPWRGAAVVEAARPPAGARAGTAWVPGPAPASWPWAPPPVGCRAAGRAAELDRRVAPGKPAERGKPALPPPGAPHSRRLGRGDPRMTLLSRAVLFSWRSQFVPGLDGSAGSRLRSSPRGGEIPVRRGAPPI